jgi:hypothetical protein
MMPFCALGISPTTVARACSIKNVVAVRLFHLTTEFEVCVHPFVKLFVAGISMARTRPGLRFGQISIELRRFRIAIMHQDRRAAGGGAGDEVGVNGVDFDVVDRNAVRATLARGRDDRGRLAAGLNETVAGR